MKPRQTADLTSKTPRGRIYQRLMFRYRKPRTSPRPDLLPSVVLSDPAPEWLVRLAVDILEHTAHQPDFGETLLEQAVAWCEAGDASTRSAWLVKQPTQPTKGRAEDDAYIMSLSSFLREAWSKGSGAWGA